MARRSLFRSCLRIALVFGVVWAAVLLYWRASYRMPNGLDVAAYLVALPLGLVAGYGGLRHGIDAARRRGQRSRDPGQAAAVAEEAAAASGDEAEAAAWQIVASAVWFPAGDTVQELAAAARGNRRVGLHPALRDTRHLPVRAAGIDGIDAASLEESGLGEAQGRALELAETVAAKLLEEHLAPTPAPRDHDDGPAAVQVEWLLPARWSDAERQAAAGLFGDRLAARGWGPAQVLTACRPVEDGAQALQRLDELRRMPPGTGVPARHLLVASDSHLDERALAALEHARDLHGPDRPDGRVPGEGACALLLERLPPGAAAATPGLHRVARGRRSKPAAADGRLDTDTLQALATQVLEGGPVAADALGHVVGDTDQRPSRVAETLAAVERILPDATAEQRLPLGVANGDSGAALALAAVAVAAELTLASGQAGLAVSVQSPTERAVALVVPPPAAVPSSTPVPTGSSS